MTGLTREKLMEMYLSELYYKPYPMQEDAILSWFSSDQGVLVCAPTGMGKTLIAHAALYEALHTGKTAYYTTPLIALTEQKFREMQERALSWGFGVEDVGLVTGNRRVNPNAKVLVVVAEILLNRLLQGDAFDFSNVSAVVMDEFHSFNDPERGIVWEFTLSLLPKHVRLMLLSATVGNSREFVQWLDRCHGRKLELVESRERRVPLVYEWVPDQLLTELAVSMTQGDGDARKTPALIFCFNREECWSTAEQLKGLPLLSGDQKSQLHAEVNRLEWRTGVGPKLKQLLFRGIGVHHAGVLPKYKRVVEDLFERKLLSFVVCTETLAAGINLPARSVVLTRLVKGPPGKERLIEPSVAHQIFGRAGRPQFDDRGYVIALAHENDVRILRWKQQYDAIPDDTKDPNLIRAKKKLKKKKPTRSENRVYWNENQFIQLQSAKPGNLASRGPLPWRLLAYMLELSPEVDRIRRLIGKRLMTEKRIEAGRKTLDRMLVMLAKGGFVRLEPPCPELGKTAESREGVEPAGTTAAPVDEHWLDLARELGLEENPQETGVAATPDHESRSDAAAPLQWVPRLAYPEPSLATVLQFRSVHPIFGAYLLRHLGKASPEERMQIFESVLEMPGSMLRYVRVPLGEELPPGPLERDVLDPELLRRGLIAVHQAADYEDDEDEEDSGPWREIKERPPTVAEKLRILFEAEFPEIKDVRVRPVWCAGEMLEFGADFNKYVTSKNLVKQEGLIFRHLLRLVLLLGEFQHVVPDEVDPQDWRSELAETADRLAACCRQVDPESTEQMIEEATAADIIEVETLDSLAGAESTTSETS